MTGEWREVTVGEIASTARNALVGGPFGSNLVSRDYVESGVPVIRGQNMGERCISGEFVYVTPSKAASLEANIARPGDIVFTQRGTLGQVSLVPAEPYERYLVSQSQMKLTVDRESADPLFFYYVFSSDEQKEYIRQHSIQTGVPHTNLGILRNTPVLLPPLYEQRAIAYILGTLDDKIELNRKMNQTLEAMARAIFKSWFVDFDPVRAKAEGRDTDLPPALAALFPDSFEDSELGEIPKGWMIKAVADLAELNGWTLSKSDDLERIEYIEISEVSKGNIGTIQIFHRGEEPSRARRRLRHGDTVLSTVRPDRGSYFLCLRSSPNLVASTGFAVFTPTKAPWSLLHAALTQSDLFEQLGHLADGGAYPAIRPEVIAQRQLPWPNKSDIADTFHRICGPLYEKAEQNRCESRALAALRDALLPKLLSGELRVDNANSIERVAV
jgi:type I restriction enzyme S subunit